MSLNDWLCLVWITSKLGMYVMTKKNYLSSQIKHHIIHVGDVACTWNCLIWFMINLVQINLPNMTLCDYSVTFDDVITLKLKKKKDALYIFWNGG